MSRILFAGDFVLSNSYKTENISNELISFFHKADLNILNLEAPVTTSNTKIIKTGPHLKANKESTQLVLNALKIDVVTLANNHILDFGSKGVVDTLNFCHENDIRTVGAGIDLQEASKTLYFDISDSKIAIVNFAENEWASASEDSAGANPMDLIENVKQIQQAKVNADFVFVIINGGHEYYNFPSPRMQKQYRFYAEQGADLIIGHHTHCISGHETYQNVPIYYSLGNFLFNIDSDFKDWYSGLILEVEIIDHKLRTKLHPITQGRNSFELNFSNPKERLDISKRIIEYNKIISESSLLKQVWESYISIKTKSVLSHWSPLAFIRNRYIKAILKKINITGSNSKGLSLYLNLMRCEAHFDISKSVLKKHIEK